MNKEIIETIFAGIMGVLLLCLCAWWLISVEREAKKEREEDRKQEKQFQDALLKQLQDANDNIKFIYECLFPTNKLKDIEDLKQ